MKIYRGGNRLLPNDDFLRWYSLSQISDKNHSFSLNDFINIRYLILLFCADICIFCWIVTTMNMPCNEWIKSSFLQFKAGCFFVRLVRWFGLLVVVGRLSLLFSCWEGVLLCPNVRKKAKIPNVGLGFKSISLYLLEIKKLYFTCFYRILCPYDF